MTEPNRSADLARRYRASTCADVAGSVVFDHAQGCYVVDVNGNRYLDFSAGYGVVGIGWQRPEMLDVLAQQLRTSTFAPPWLPNAPAVELAELLISLTPPHLTICGRATGGAEANEVALKAHFTMRGGRLLVIGRSYHGGTAETLALSDAKRFNLPQVPATQPTRVPPAYCYRCPWGKTYPDCSLECVEAVEQAIVANTAITAILLEPILGSGGVIVPPQEYFNAIQDLCSRRNLTLILDEVITGCGRLGTFSATEAFGLKPDAITLAKGLSSGYAPIGAAVLSAELGEGLMQHEDVSATFAWTPFTCTAATTNLNIILREELISHAQVMGEKLKQGLAELFDRVLPAHVGNVRGKGLLIGVELVTDPITREPAIQIAKRITILAARAGLMLNCSWDWHTLVFSPPLIITDRHVEEALNVLESVLTRISRNPGE